MKDSVDREPMLDMFLFETVHLVELLEQLILDSEVEKSTREIFRFMHTIKGSAALMLFGNISSVAHAVEDVFFFLHDQPKAVHYPELTDILLKSIDFIKQEIAKIENEQNSDGDAGVLIDSINSFYASLRKTDFVGQTLSDLYA